MSFAIARFRKIKQQDQSKHNGVLIHNLRTEIHSNVNPEKIKLNKILMGCNTPQAIKNNLACRWKKLDDTNPRKTRKDAVGSLELILTASNDFFNADLDFNAWVQANVDFAIAEYGEENIVSAILHMDETTPHIHLLIVPVVEGRLNAKLKVGNKLAMSQYQNRYSTAMAKFGLVRGKCIYAEEAEEPTKHIDPSQYIKDLKITNQNQVQEIAKLKRGIKTMQNYLKMMGMFDKFVLWIKEKNMPLKRAQSPLKTIFDNSTITSIKKLFN